MNPQNSSQTTYGSVGFQGSAQVINGVALNVLMVNQFGHILFANGNALITDGSAGYSKGSQFILNNATTGSPCLYINKGSTASSQFTLSTQA